MKTTEALKVKIVIVLALCMLLASSLAIFSNAQPATNDQTRLVMDKESYAISDNIVVDISPQGLRGINLNDKYEFWLYSTDSRSKYLGPLVFPLAMGIGREGNYIIYLYDKYSGILVDTKKFSIGPSSQNPITGDTIIKDNAAQNNQNNSNNISNNGTNISSPTASETTTPGTCGLKLTVKNIVFQIGDRIDISMQGTALGDATLRIQNKDTTFRFVGELKSTFFVPPVPGTYSIILACKSNITENITVYVVPNATGNQTANITNNNTSLSNITYNTSDINGSNTSINNSFYINNTSSTNYTNQSSNQTMSAPGQMPQTEQKMTRDIFIRDSKGNSRNGKMKLSNVIPYQTIYNYSNTTQNSSQNNMLMASAAEVDISAVQGLEAKLLSLNNLLFNEADPPSINIEKVENQDVNRDQTTPVESYAIDLSRLNFTNGTLTKTAKGTELWKCIQWDFPSRTCLGSWQKVMDIAPGKEYTVQLSPTDPGYTETGLATVNTEKSIYSPDEIARIFMVVLDTQGHLVPNADITLNVTKPDNTTYTLTTANSEISQIEKGIYETQFTNTDEQGTYILDINAKAGDVNSDMHSSFLVLKDYPFDILRTTPVTIDPAKGPVSSSIRIISRNQSGLFDFVEIIPIAFNITSKGGASESIVGGQKQLRWYNLSNDSIVTYQYQAPPNTPMLYELGQSSVFYDSGTSIFLEARQWFIAVDPSFSGQFFMLWDGTTTVPNGWTCVSCNSGDPFFNRFLRGEINYGAQGGNLSHNHTVSYVGETQATTSQIGDAGAFGAIPALNHAHGGIVATTTTPASNMPPYRQLIVMSYNGIPWIIPNGTIAIFNTTNLPANWTLYTAENGYFILGNSTANVTGGSANHTHNLSIITSIAPDAQQRTNNNAVTVTAAVHTHTGNGTTNSSINIPQYIDVVLAEATNDTTIPYGKGFIGMFNGAVIPGWLNMSQSGDPFYQKLVRANASYGGTGGANTTTHANTNITTGAPNGTITTRNNQGLTSFPAGTHTHNISVSFSTDDTTPPYINVVFGYANESILFAPSIYKVECFRSGAGWGNCSLIGFGNTVTGIRANCTSINPGGKVHNVTFTLINIDKNITYFNTTTTDNSTGYWNISLNKQFMDSGDYTLDVVCKENPESTFDFNWTIPFGNLTPRLVWPTITINVTQNRLFNFTVNVTCVGGECGDLNATLDPAIPWWDTTYAYRRQINITNNTVLVKQNYSVMLLLNTTVSKFQANGSDVRIVLYNSSGWTELDRVNETSFNSSNTSIWFKLRGNITANGFNSSYYVYYGNVAPSAPPENRSNVYIWFDDFNRPNKADITTEAAYNRAGAGVWNISGNRLFFSQGAGDPNKLRVAALSTPVDDVEMLVKFNATAFPAAATSIFGLSQDMDDVGGAGRGYSGVFNWNAASQLRFRNDVVAYGTSANFAFTNNQVYNMRYKSVNPASPGARLKYWSVNISEPAGWNLTGNYGTNNRNSGYVGVVGANANIGIYFDDLQIRLVVTNEPNTTLGPEQTGVKGLVPMGSGTPFYTFTANPAYPSNFSCLGNMTNGSTCPLTWLLNATGAVNSTWEFFSTFYEMNYTSTISNMTPHVNITIIGNVVPVAQSVLIMPNQPLYTDDLNCSFNVTDQNFGDSLSATVNWYRNGVFITSQSLSVKDGIQLSAILSSSYLTVGDLWSCGITPYDQQLYGTELQSYNVTILSSIPPNVNDMQCLRNNSIWVQCSSIIYNNMISKVRANCTSATSTPMNVTFALTNIEDNNTYFSGTTTDNSTGYWVFDNPDLTLRDSGNFNLAVSCTDVNGTTGINYSNWFIPWGNLSVKLVSPNYSMNVTSRQYFNFTSSLTCVGGECGYINVTLDPFKEYFHSFENTPENWTHMANNGTANGNPAVGNDQWHVDSNAAKFGNYSWRDGPNDLGNYTTPPGAILTTMMYAIRTNIRPATVFTFYHYVSSEFTWDGGKLEYKLDNGPWTKFQNASFLNGGYNYAYAINPAFVPAGWVNGELIWTNISGGINNFTYVRVNISNMTGENLTIRFNFGGDDNTAGMGWFIDGFNITAWDYDNNKGVVSMNTSALPFYTITQNPATYADVNFTCLANMHAGDVCNSTWIVNASDIRGTYTFFVDYESVNYSGKVIDKNTSQINLTIIGNVPPLVPSVTLYPQFAVLGVNLTCSFAVTDQSPLDTLGANVFWYRNNTMMFSTNYSVQYNVTYNATLLSTNLSVGDTWFCGVRPYDQQSWGVQVNSTNRTVISSIPPKLNAIQCLRNDTTWVNCFTLGYGEKFSGVRANCSNGNSTISNVTFNFSNTPDSKVFFRATAAQNVSDWFSYYYNMTMADSGEYVMQVTCMNNASVPDAGNVTWSLPWGRLYGMLVDPFTNVSVEYNQFFTFTANISCLGGECGNISALLDPGFAYGSPTNGTADNGSMDNPSGGDTSSGNYSNTWANDSLYYIVGKIGWGDANSRLELDFNVSTLNISPYKNITNINITTSYCHSGNTLANFAANGCDGSNITGKAFTEPQDVMLYNTLTGNWDSIGALNTTDRNRLVYDNFSTYGSLSKYVNLTTGYIRVRFEMITDGNVITAPAWLGMNYVMLSLTYQFSKNGAPVSTIVGDLPFYTNNSNPYTPAQYLCLANMTSLLQQCQLTWYVNATGAINSTHEFWVYYNASNYKSYVSPNTSAHIFITIQNGSAVPPASTLNAPPDNTYTSNSTTVFNCSATDNKNLSSITLYSDFLGYFASNNTASVTGKSNTSTFNLSLSEGRYIWNCLATDSDGNARFAVSNRTLTIDQSPPLINLTSPGISESLNTRTVKFNFTVTDNFDTSMLCNLSLDGVLNITNFAASNWSNISKTIYNLSQGDHNWSVNCIDDAGNNNISETRNFTVLSTIPIVIPQTIDKYYTNQSTVNLVYYTDDGGYIVQADLYINGLWNYTDPFVTTGANNVFTVPNLPQGSYVWVVNVTNNGGLTNQTLNRTFFVEFSSPNINVSFPQDPYVNNLSTVLFNFTATDLLDPALTCKITINGVDVATGINANNGSLVSWPVAGLKNGPNYWNITCQNDAGNKNTSTTRLMNVSAPPLVNLGNPVNLSSQKNPNITLFYTPSAGTNLSNCSLYLNGVKNQTNSTPINNNLNSFPLFGLPDSMYNWSVSCTDNTSVTGSSFTKVFFIDTTPPNISLNKPDDNGTAYGSTTMFNFTVFDNLDTSLTCSLIIDGLVNKTGIAATNATPVNVSVPVSEGNHSWSVTCLDDALNSNTSVTRNFTVIGVPTVTPVVPAPNAYLNYSTNVNFSYIPSSGNTLVNATLYINGIANQSAINPNNGAQNTFLVNFSTNGLYNWSVTLIDSMNLTGSSVTRNFTIDTIAPGVGIITPTNGQTVGSNNVTFSFNVSENLAAAVLCNISISDVVEWQNVSMTNGNSNTRYKIMPDGNYNWSVTCIDNTGNYNPYILTNFTVLAPPNVTLNSPTQNFRTSNRTVIFNYTPNDTIGLVNCSLYINGAFNQSTDYVSNNTQNYFNITDTPDGDYNWTVMCVDYPDSNRYAPVERNFTVDTVGPSITMLNPNEGDFTSANVIFNWTATDYPVIINCSLYVDGVWNSNLSQQSGTYFNKSVTGIPTGQHNWTVSCIDDLGNRQTSFTRNFTVNKPDLYIDSSRISFNNTNPNENDTINITVNVSNIGGVNAINATVAFWDGDPALGGIYIGNVTANVSFNTSRIYSVTWNISLGMHMIYISADPLNQIIESDESNNNATRNISLLRAAINSPLNASMYNYSLIEFNYTLQDFTGGLINYSIFINNVNSGQQGQTADNVSTLVNITVSQGIRSVIFEALDALGRRKNSTARFVIVDFMPPNGTINTPNLSWFNYSRPQINISATDNVDTAIDYTMYINNVFDSFGQINNSTSININLSARPDGIYTLILEVKDDLNNSANTTIKTIYVDTTKPAIMLTAPQDGANFTNRSVMLNFTVTDNLANSTMCTINIDGSVKGPFSINNTLILGLGNYTATNLAEGTHTWNVSCADAAGNQNTSLTSTFNTFAPPNITLVSPTNATWTSNENRTFIYNVSDDTGLTNCSLIINGVINQTNTTGQITNNGTNSFTVNYLNGTYLWAVECYDNTTLQLYTISESRFLYVDLDKPSSVILTANNTWFRTGAPNLSFILSDNMDPVLNYTFYVNDAPNITGTSGNNTTNSKLIFSLQNGTNRIIIEAIDLANNRKNSSEITIYIDTVKPSVNLTYPGNNSNFTATTLDLNFTPNDNLAPTLTCNVTLDTTLVAQNLTINTGQNQNVTVNVLGSGYHYWNVTCIDLAGNYNTSETWRFYVFRPDISVSQGEIFFSNPAPIENETINITATVRNIGNRDAGNFTVQFWRGNQSLGGQQIGQNFSFNLTAGESVNLTVNFTSLIGTNQIFVLANTPLATNGTVDEENYSNNIAIKNLTVGLWQFMLGLTTDRLVINDNSTRLLFDWEVDNITGSNIFVTDFGSNVHWTKLQAIGRNVSNLTNVLDFETLDRKLGSSNMSDSVNNTYTSSKLPKETGTYTIYNRLIENVSIYNSTNNSNFKTGILWDYGDGGQAYNGSQNILFITTINQSQQGYNGTYDYELRVPATLRQYRGPDFFRVEYYVEIR